MIEKIDAWVCAYTQAGCDFLWDRFGVTKGALFALAVVVAVLLNLQEGNIFSSFLATPFLWVGWWMRGLQAAGQYQRLNIIAERNRNNLFPMFFRFPMSSLNGFIWWVQDQPPATFIILFCYFIGTYLVCVSVRDREPPEHLFFSPQAM